MMELDDENAKNSTENGACDTIEVINYGVNYYNAKTLQASQIQSIRSLSRVPNDRVRWINVDGQCSKELLDLLGTAFKIHPLVISDIPNNGQRAKIEEYQNFLYIVSKMVYFADHKFVEEHINIILGKNYLISFGETEGDVFDNIRSRLKKEGSLARNFGPDFLLYLILDAIVEGYFDVLEELNEKIDALEDQVMANTAQGHLLAIGEIKKTLFRVNKYIWPLRDVASLIGKETSDLIRPTTQPYLREIYNHIVQAIETAEACREVLSSLTDLHISNTSYRLNEIMKVLTVISTIFIPLTFIVGVYGMNFLYMPELKSRWGYAIVWLVMLAIAGCMIYYFKKKKWF